MTTVSMPDPRTSSAFSPAAGVSPAVGVSPAMGEGEGEKEGAGLIDVSVDVETYSGADLRRVGVYRYADDPDFQMLLISYQIGEGEVRTIDLMEDTYDDSEFRAVLFDPRYRKHAFNANFERVTLAAHYGRICDPRQWECTMVRGLVGGLPAALYSVGKALGLPEDKQKMDIGKQLISYFCKPCVPTKKNGGRTRNLPCHNPEAWEQFKTYNAQDVVAEHEILKRLSYITIPDEERNLWILDQEINDRGILVDIPMAETVVREGEKYQSLLFERAVALTGLENPNSPSQLKEYMRAHGQTCESLDKDHVERYLKEYEDPDCLEALRLRQMMSRTSTKKYNTMVEASCRDDRIRGTLQFYGAARSGRWAGRILQVQNLARSDIEDLDFARELAREGDLDAIDMLYGDIPDTLSQLVRTALIAKPGHKLIVSDFGQIEARVISALAGETWRLEAFAAGEDLYSITASRMYGVPVVKHGENAHLRQRGKVAELACGYGGGVVAMQAMDKSHSIPEEELQEVVDQWRRSNPRICKLWREFGEAATRCIRDRRPVRTHGCRFTYSNSTMFIELPSQGHRRLAYYQARVGHNAHGTEEIYYLGTQVGSRAYGETSSWGGKLTENIVQAVARDCLAQALLKVDQAGYNVIFSVHDELIAEVPDGQVEAAKNTIDQIMAEPVEFLPTMPLKGDTYEAAYYRK